MNYNLLSVSGLDSPDLGDIMRPRNLTVKVRALKETKPAIDVGSPKLRKVMTVQTSKHVKIQTFKDQNRQMLSEANEWANTS